MRFTLALSYLTLLTGCWIDKTRLCETGAAQTPLICTATTFTDRTNRASAQFGTTLSLLNDELIVGDPEGKDELGKITGLAQSFDTAQPASHLPFLMIPKGLNSNGVFGSAVAVSNNFACIGAPNTSAPSVYCYSRPLGPASTPSESIARLSGAPYGKDFALDGDTLLVAMDNQLFFNTTTLGASGWSEGMLAVADTTATITSVALSGSRAVVFSSSTMNGSKLSMLTKSVGGTWELNPQDFPLLSGFKIPAADAKLAMSGTDLLVTLEPVGSTKQAVVHYSLEAGVWSNPSVVLSNLDPVTSLSIAGDLAAVGVLGTAWVLRRACGKWESQKLANPPLLRSSFGTAVSVSGSKVAVGAPTMGDPSVYVYTCN